MSQHWWVHGVGRLAHEKKEPKAAGIALIVIGFFFAPVLIGIPIMMVGFYKLCK